MKVFGSSPFFCQYASMTSSTTSGCKQRGQRGQALDRHAEPNRHARHRDKFGPAGPDRCRSAWLNALALKTAVGLGEICAIVVNVRCAGLRGKRPRRARRA